MRFMFVFLLSIFPWVAFLHSSQRCFKYHLKKIGSLLLPGKSFDKIITNLYEKELWPIQHLFSTIFTVAFLSYIQHSPTCSCLCHLMQQLNSKYKQGMKCKFCLIMNNIKQFHDNQIIMLDESEPWRTVSDERKRYERILKHKERASGFVFRKKNFLSQKGMKNLPPPPWLSKQIAFAKIPILICFTARKLAR
ncbi:CLUMA_CG000884, isoform A [Clunio marinus]|uniref:CLUMA_CG000884, isoform A n=1 Tax=Clunio marinus TaxID=568069 RepID=A0A1J1HKZ1_9DIPT|nr:CLUMA_CG000884, isoform A [Clunio marinus]